MPWDALNLTELLESFPIRAGNAEAIEGSVSIVALHSRSDQAAGLRHPDASSFRTICIVGCLGLSLLACRVPIGEDVPCWMMLSLNTCAAVSNSRPRPLEAGDDPEQASFRNGPGAVGPLAVREER